MIRTDEFAKYDLSVRLVVSDEIPYLFHSGNNHWIIHDRLVDRFVDSSIHIFTWMKTSQGSKIEFEEFLRSKMSKACFGYGTRTQTMFLFDKFYRHKHTQINLIKKNEYLDVGLIVWFVFFFFGCSLFTPHSDLFSILFFFLSAHIELHTHFLDGISEHTENTPFVFDEHQMQCTVKPLETERK